MIRMRKAYMGFIIIDLFDEFVAEKYRGVK